MILDQKQKQFWNRHAKRNNNPRDANVSVLLGAFVSRSSDVWPALWYRCGVLWHILVAISD